MYKLHNIRKSGDSYIAELFDCNYNQTIPIIILPGVEDCNWVAINQVTGIGMWDIVSVGNNKENIEDWQDGDIVVLGNAIQ